MTKEMREYLDKLEQLKVKAKALREDPEAKLEDIEAMTNDIKVLNAKINALKIEEETESTQEGEVLDDGISGSVDANAYTDAFYAAVQGRKLTQAQAEILETQGALTTTTGEDGGYIIPTDEVVKIKELKRTLQSLETEVNVEPVSTSTGSRVIEKDAEHTPFTTFAEGDDVPASDSPQFNQVSYTILDRGGILPIPNNLLKDSTANVAAYIRKWLAKKQVATRNSLIIAVLKTLVPTAIADFDDIKGALNVVLDPSIANGAKIYTNQDGFNFLDTLKDSDGNYIMTPDVTDKGKYKIKGKPVVVYSNKTWATRDDAGTMKAPIVIGDLKETVTLFDREQMSLLSTSIGGTAFTKNRTDTRAITREDVKLIDSDAVVFGEAVIV